MANFEIQQLQPIADAALRNHSAYRGRKLSPRDHVTHTPPPKWIEAKHHKVPVRAQDPIHLTQQGVRIGGILESMRQHHRIQGFARDSEHIKA
jgi:hypothetical protein